MTLEEAIATQPIWITYWLNWMLVGAFILPLTLLIWKKSRLAGVLAVLASGLAGFGTDWLYGQMGYVKLLGLPHIIFWTPLVLFLIGQLRRDDMPVWPRRIILVILATILVSLAFDYTDAILYLLGERAPAAGTV